MKADNRQVEDLLRIVAGKTAEALRNRSAGESELTPEALFRILAAERDLVHALAGGDLLMANLGGQAAGPAAERRIGQQPGEGKAGKEDYWHALLMLEEKAAAADRFFRSSLSFLAELARTRNNGRLNQHLDRIRTQLRDGADPVQLEEEFRELKNLTLHQAAGGAARKKGDQRRFSFLSGWFKGEEAPVAGSNPEGHVEAVERLRENYQEIVNALKLNMDDEGLLGISRLEAEIRAIRGVDEFPLARRGIIALIQDYIARLNAEREQAATFIREISTSLVEVETHFLTSLSETRQVYSSSSQLGVMLEGEVSDLNDSINDSRSLAELKSLVVSKLAKIKSVLAARIKEDQMRRKALLDRTETIHDDFERMKKEIVAARERAKRLEQELLQDPLTGIYNRRAYDKRVKEELSRFQRYGGSFSLFLFDVDHFKTVNDRFGHVVGDKVLKEIVIRVRSVLRGSDFMARFGGEEFVVLLPETPGEGAVTAAEKIRKLIEQTEFIHKEEQVAITISAGVTEARPEDLEVETLFHRMDMAMYEAKNTGRNRVVAK